MIKALQTKIAVNDPYDTRL